MILSLFIPIQGYTLLKTDRLGDGEKAKAFCKKWIEEHPVRPTSEESPGLNEDDADWVRNDAVGEPFPVSTRLHKYNPKFTPEDYKTCE